MELMNERNFTIVDPIEMKTIAFVVNKTEESSSEVGYSLQKLDCSTQREGDKVKKTFFINEPMALDETKDVVLLTMGNDKAMLNSAVLQSDKLFISKSPAPLEYKTLYSEQVTEYRDIRYTPNFKRPISIIDPETGDEVRPVLYFDDEANMVRGKIKLMPFKSYIALEVRG